MVKKGQSPSSFDVERTLLFYSIFFSEVARSYCWYFEIPFSLTDSARSALRRTSLICRPAISRTRSPVLRAKCTSMYRTGHVFRLIPRACCQPAWLALLFLGLIWGEGLSLQACQRFEWKPDNFRCCWVVTGKPAYRLFSFRCYFILTRVVIR